MIANKEHTIEVDQDSLRHNPRGNVTEGNSNRGESVLVLFACKRITYPAPYEIMNLGEESNDQVLQVLLT
jgi:hypothetical protein